MSTYFNKRQAVFSAIVVFVLLFSSIGSNLTPTVSADQSSLVKTDSPSTQTRQPDVEPKVVKIAKDPIPARVIIQFAPNSTANQRVSYIKSIGGTVLKHIGSLNTVVIAFREDLAQAPLPDSAIVAGTEADYYVSALDLIPNDPRYAEQWALPAIGAPYAWEQMPADAPKVTVAVIDSGTCASHPDLAGRLVAGWDFIESDAAAQDEFGHGCSISGVIAANMNDGIGISGVAPNAQIMPLRVLNASGVGSYSDVAAAIVYAADNGAQVINLSLGGSNPSTTLENAVDYAISKDVTVVAAAGNGGTEGALYPAAYPNVIAVGSVDLNLQPSSFSNYGSQIDIWAPGRDILTVKPDGGYELVSGTSFAAPHVAGAEAVAITSGTTVTTNPYGLLSLGDSAALATQTPLPATTTPAPTQLPTIAPTTIPGLDPSSAGIGSLYRAQVRLKQPLDLTRLADWDITVLEQAGGFAVVQATSLHLSKLARLGFEPTQIDSVDYMLTVQSLTTGEVLSLSDVTSSATEMMALASVDSDSDGLTDTEESWWCTNPNDENSDSPQPSSGTNPNDGNEVNNILRGIIAYGPPFALWPSFTPHNPNGTCPDGDFDGVPDYAEEFMIGTSNLRESSDKDKFDDGQELFGVTYCPASSGPCGYGILPRAEDAAFVSANLPAWVLPPGNSPWVAAFPEPIIEIVPSSIVIKRIATITTSEGTVQGTEETYGTTTTKGTSSSVADTVTWEEWQEVANTQYQSTIQSMDVEALGTDLEFEAKADINATAQGAGCGLALGCIAANINSNIGSIFGDWDFSLITINTGSSDQVQQTTQVNQYAANNTSYHISTPQEDANLRAGNLSMQDRQPGGSGTQYGFNDSGIISVQKYIEMKFPVLQSSSTSSNGSSRGGAKTTTHQEYEEQSISEASTNQFSQSWSSATSIDSGHAADLQFTYNIANSGTEYAREVTNLTFNIFIGENSNPIYSYTAVGNTDTPKVENLFPGEILNYTSNPIPLTLEEMRAIDEGEAIRIVMEDVSFGQDQVFYLDAINGSVKLAIEDGFEDFDELMDVYFIPVWDPSDTLQDVAKRFFPSIEDENGNMLAIFTPESVSSIPTGCVQDQDIAPASYTTVFCKHALTGTSWWNIYLSEGLEYSGVFSNTLAAPNTSALIRIVSDRDLDGYNDRNEIRLGTDPDDAASHPSPNLIAGYTTFCTGNDCTVRMVFQNLGDYDAYGVESVMYSPDGLVNITNNTIGGSGRVPAGERIIVGPSDTFQYTKSAGSAEPVIVVSYNDPQGNHRFILPSGNYPTGAKIATLNDTITALNGYMLLDPGVDISSTSTNQAGFVINSPHPTTITSGKLFVEYIDRDGNVLHEDVTAQDFDSGPTVVQQNIDLGTYPPDTTILLAFLTDSAGNIIDSSARPLASFGADPSPEANITVDNWEIGAQSIVSIPDPWNLGTFEPGSTLHAKLYLTNTGLGDLRYSLTGLGSGWSIAGNSAGTLGPTQQNVFVLSFDSAGMMPQTINHSLYLRTNDPANGTLTINLQATLSTPTGTATAYQVSPDQPWNQFVYVPGPHSQNDIVNFTHTLADDPSRMFPLYMYDEAGTTLKGVGEYGVDFSGQTAPFGVFGTGADGDLTVTTGQTIYTDNTRSAVSSTANSAQPNIALSSVAGFAAGQEVLIIQIQGTGAGLYEFANIANVSSNSLILTKNLTNLYTVGGTSKAQAIRVPNYRNITIQSGGTLTAHAWDGNHGGIVAFRASGTVSVSGSIIANSIGFRGGNGIMNGVNGSIAYSGEGTSGVSYATNSSNGNGGGGAKQFGDSTLDRSGGAGGGNGSNGNNGYNIYTPSRISYGGLSSGVADLSIMVLGGGGGGGVGGGDNPGDNGGNGGGIIFIAAQNLTASGAITANGANSVYRNGGNQDTAAGGGGGGSILIKSKIAGLGSNRLNALNGVPIDHGTVGNSGAGGVGRIRVEYGTLSGTTNPSASTQQVNYYSITGQGAPFGVFGNGSDGDLTVTTGQTIYTDNVRSALATTAASGQPNITVSNAAGFTVGKEVMIIQSQGTGAGAYEFAAIIDVSGTTLTLSKPLGSTYTTGGNSKAQVLVVPQYHDVTIQNGSVLTAHAWDGITGGVVAFRANSAINVSGTITATGKGFRGGAGGINVSAGYQGGGSMGLGAISINANGNGGGGGGLQTSGGTFEGPGGGGGSNGTEGANGNNVGSTGIGGTGGSVVSNSELTILTFGGGGGGGSGISQYSANRGYFSTGGKGGNGGGIVLINALNIVVTGSIAASGTNGSGATGASTFAGAGGGGAGGSVLIKAYSATLGSNLINFTNGSGAIALQNPQGNGGDGGDGRIRIEYNTMTGTTNPVASTQQVNYYNLTGSSSNTLYVPDVISTGNHARYVLLYGQRSVNTTAGDQLYTVHLANRQYSSVNLGALVERAVGSGSTFNFCLDFGNDGTCDYIANNQAFTGPVRLDSTNVAGALNAYITAQGSSAPVLTIPIRVNLSTQADIFLFNLSATPLTGIDLQPSVPVIAPQNGNPANNIPEGTLVDLSATITNSGITNASNFTVAFYLGDPAESGTLIGSRFIQSLAAGSTSPAQIVAWNTSGLLGSKAIYVKVDSSNVVVESNEANNTASASAIIKKKPDLVMMTLTVPDVRQNETGSASVIVKNAGEADAANALIKLYDGSPETGTLLGSTIINVAQGATVTGQISFSIPTVGTHLLSAKADPLNTILEADEANNTSSTNAKVGWGLLTIDAGGGTDIAYSSSSGNGYQLPSTAVISCGTQIEKSYREAGSAETVTYKIDNLLPGRRYHLDLTFATCSGERWVNMFVDNNQVYETFAYLVTGSIPALHVTSTPQTVSVLLDPDDYSDGSITVAIQRASGLNGPLVNIIDLQEITYCYRDSGPGETPWNTSNQCGYDPTTTSDGFNGWGNTPEKTVRFGSAQDLFYKFTSLATTKLYNAQLTFYEGDSLARSERILFDGVQAQTVTLSGTMQRLNVAIPQAAYLDGSVNLNIQRTVSGDSIVSEIALEENTRLENSRYPAPPPPSSVTPTPTAPVTPPSTPQVILSTFTATWVNNKVDLRWSTTTEINNSVFKVFRSGDSIVWTEIASVNSTRPCGNYTGTTPVAYSYLDSAVSMSNTYYYRIQYSGQNCGGGLATGAQIIQLDPPGSYPMISSIVRANPNPTNLASVNFNIIFSESVTGVDIDDFSLIAAGVVGATVSDVSGSGATRIVTVSTGVGDGTIRLDVVDNNTIIDGAGNPLGGINAGDGDFTTGEAYMINKSSTFMDVPLDHWAGSYIERLYLAGITGGCGTSPLKYCPDTTVTRSQMAVFLERGIHGSSYSPPALVGGTGFGDVPVDYWSAVWIKQLAAEGITGGCGSGNYCPEYAVTRDQMAVFLLRSKYGSSYSPPAVGISTGFGDVPVDHWAAPWIKQLVTEGITAGCGSGNYCPSTPVSRAQMAVFLVRTFNLP